MDEKDNKDRKKGKRIVKIFRFIAIAFLVGLLEGTVVWGYGYLTRDKDDRQAEQVIEDEQNDLYAPGESGLRQELLSKNEEPDVPAEAAGKEIVSDVSDIVKKVMPSIVAINASTTTTKYDFFGRQFQTPAEGSGSGIIIAQNDDSILILTNNHVIEGAQRVEIVFSDDTTADASIRGAEAGSDLAVLEVKLKDLSAETQNTIKVARLGNSDLVEEGQMAIAIGNALGYGQSTTVGYISALDREITVENNTMVLLQTDAAINPGNSGGALLNIEGEVIGINSVKFASQNVEGMGYAIPISRAIPIINALMNRKVIEEGKSGFLGINLQEAQEVTQWHTQQFNMPEGIYINEIVKDSPAEKAGIKKGHIITKVEGIKVKTIEELAANIGYYSEGDEITITIAYVHEGGYMERDILVTLGKRPE